MPKIEIDYSNTIIYKITCKDPAITDVYVGHTTNFVQRKHAHKQSCISAKSANHNCKLYQVMRNNGGWENWHMEIINFYKCHDHYEARQKEQEYFISLHATLNSIEPMPKPKPKEIIIKKNVIKQDFYCNVCNTHCDSMASYETHNETKKHKKNTANSQMEVVKLAENSPKFVCEYCDYKCSKSHDMLKHKLSLKHKRNADGSIGSILEEISRPTNYDCKCGKKYITHGGFWKHKKKCITSITPTEKKNETKT
jgi:hypothetical protein